MKRKLLQHEMYWNIGIALSLIVLCIGLYILFYKREQFIELCRVIGESILFGLSLTFTAIFDKMFPHRHYYERRNRATIIKSSIVDTGLIHKRSVSEDERTIRGKQISVRKNKGTNKKRLNKK